MTRILRSMLYVPANSWRMINNATGEGADAVILDLEDGCPMPEKETGRVFARDSVPMLKEHGLDVLVRVNSLETGLTETDIGYVTVQGLDGIMLAKTESEGDIRRAEGLLKQEEDKKGLAPGSVALMALIETPKGIMKHPGYHRREQADGRRGIRSRRLFPRDGSGNGCEQALP